jgi:hypothetical protein
MTQKPLKDLGGTDVKTGTAVIAFVLVFCSEFFVSQENP